MLGLDFAGEVFQDHFLIADIRMKAERPSERWFWFDPPFARGQSALLHKQPDDVWRLDFQLGWDIERAVELDPARITERVRRMLGEDAQFELEWSSIYTFQCRMLDRFVHDRVVFAGDAAHLVSPFGARGANGGVQDVDNLCWKLALVQQGVAPRSLLASYDAERVTAARENLLHSTRSTDFITPKGDSSRAFRNAVLSLARDHPFARAYVNSGRLSLPAVLGSSPLLPPGGDAPGTALAPGSPAGDAPIRTRDGTASWLLSELGGGFTLLCFGRRRQVCDGSVDAPRARRDPACAAAWVGRPPRPRDRRCNGQAGRRSAGCARCLPAVSAGSTPGRGMARFRRRTGYARPSCTAWGEETNREARRAPAGATARRS